MRKILLLCFFVVMWVALGYPSDAVAKGPKFVEREIKVTGDVIAQERTYTESGRVIFERAGDYSLERKNGGIENFRIGERESNPHHEIQVEAGDKLRIEPPTLKK